MNAHQARARVMSALARFEQKRQRAAKKSEDTMAMKSAAKKFAPTYSLGDDHAEHKGYYLGFRDVDCKNSEGEEYVTRVHEFKAKGSFEPSGLWGSTALDAQLEQVPVGAYCEITYDGLQRNPKTKRKYNACTVNYDDADIIDPKKGENETLSF